MYTANLAIMMRFSTSVNLDPLCKRIQEIMQAAKEAGRLYIDDVEDFCGSGVARSDCTNVGPVTVEWRKNMEAMFSFDLQFTECFDHTALVHLYAPILEAALLPEDKTVVTFNYVNGATTQDVKILGYYGDWDFPEVG